MCEEDLNMLKNYILKCLSLNPKLEKRCQNVKQIWLTFYEPGEKREGCLVKELMYDDGILYYPYNKDEFESWNRNLKLKSLTDGKDI